MQPWQDDLPLLLITSSNVTSAANNVTSPANNNRDEISSSTGQTTWELDIGVIAFSFSFTVICLLILVQVYFASHDTQNNILRLERQQGTNFRGVMGSG
jgi:hypothetical protein